jgi:hypothetical protein
MAGVGEFEVAISGGVWVAIRVGQGSRLNEDVIDLNLSLYVLSVLLRFAGHVFVTTAPFCWLHVHHPEVIGERADDIDGLFESVFNLEAQSVQADDLNCENDLVFIRGVEKARLDKLVDALLGSGSSVKKLR